MTNALATPYFSENEFLVYPNPAHSVVNLTLPESYGEVQIFIYNQLGQEIVNKKIKRENPVFSVENLQSGIYLYKIKAGNTYKTGKLAVK